MAIQKKHFLISAISLSIFLALGFFLFFSPEVNSRTKKIIKSGRTIKVIRPGEDSTKIAKADFSRESTLEKEYYQNGEITCSVERQAIQELQTKVDNLKKLEIQNKNLEEENLNLRRQLAFYVDRSRTYYSSSEEEEQEEAEISVQKESLVRGYW